LPPPLSLFFETSPPFPRPSGRFWLIFLARGSMDPPSTLIALGRDAGEALLQQSDALLLPELDALRQNSSTSSSSSSGGSSQQQQQQKRGGKKSSSSSSLADIIPADFATDLGKEFRFRHYPAVLLLLKHALLEHVSTSRPNPAQAYADALERRIEWERSRKKRGGNRKGSNADSDDSAPDVPTGFLYLYDARSGGAHSHDSIVWKKARMSVKLIVLDTAKGILKLKNHKQDSGVPVMRRQTWTAAPGYGGWRKNEYKIVSRVPVSSTSSDGKASSTALAGARRSRSTSDDDVIQTVEHYPVLVHFFMKPEDAAGAAPGAGSSLASALQIAKQIVERCKAADSESSGTASVVSVSSAASPRATQTSSRKRRAAASPSPNSSSDSESGSSRPGKSRRLKSTAASATDMAAESVPGSDAPVAAMWAAPLNPAQFDSVEPYTFPAAASSSDLTVVGGAGLQDDVSILSQLPHILDGDGSNSNSGGAESVGRPASTTDFEAAAAFAINAEDSATIKVRTYAPRSAFVTEPTRVIVVIEFPKAFESPDHLGSFGRGLDLLGSEASSADLGDRGTALSLRSSGGASKPPHRAEAPFSRFSFSCLFEGDGLRESPCRMLGPSVLEFLTPVQVAADLDGSDAAGIKSFQIVARQVDGDRPFSSPPMPFCFLPTVTDGSRGRVSLAFRNIGTPVESFAWSGAVSLDLVVEFRQSVRELDLSNNSLTNLEFLARFDRLHSLILDNNQLHDRTQFPSLPNLRTLTLNNNSLGDLAAVIDSLAACFPNLQYLSLLGNPCCPVFTGTVEECTSYRQLVVSRFPSLTQLDSTPISHSDVAGTYISSLVLPPFLCARSSNKGTLQIPPSVLHSLTRSGRFGDINHISTLLGRDI
jgi:Leucine-rich repeat